MQFRLLGPVEIEIAGRPLPLPRRRDRCLLSVLLLEANRMVPTSRLTDLLWDGHPPAGARRSLYGQVSRLRAVLAAGSPRNGPPLVTLGEGYRLEVDPQQVDVFQFRELVRTATASEQSRQVELLRTALDLWRGPVLGNAATAWLRDRLCSGVEEERLAAVEQLMSASLALRREREVLPELADLAAAHPGRESLTALHMQALYLADRKTDALDVYVAASAYLAEELGLDPGPRLRGLHEAILRDQLDIPTTPIAADPAPAQAGPHPTVTPRQLPPDTAGFTGRTSDLSRLDALLAGADATAVMIAVIGGAAGVGKTSLAVRWAHRIRDRYPDGQLYVDLRGFAAEARLRPIEALAGFLHALGVPGGEVPATVEEAAARYRSLLADQRMLVILDNAADSDQVRPLLPGTPGCLVVVTSRHQLGGLIAQHGAHWLQLKLLEPAAAQQLLEYALGADRVRAEPGPTAALARLCGYLPLALRIVAANLTVRPARTIADQVALLEEQGRLAALAVDGDPDLAVTVAFDLSYQRLAEPVRRLFRLLGLVPGPAVTAEAAAALADVPPAVAAELLRTLHRVQLLDEPVAGRYTCHDLLRAYASARVVADESAADRDAARLRLLDWYGQCALAADRILYPHVVRLPADGRPAVTAPFDDPGGAMAWLAAERANLLAAVTHAAAAGPRHIAWELAHSLRGFWWQRGYLVDGLTAAGAAESAAAAADDPLGQATAQLSLGHVRGFQGHYAEAIDHFERAVAPAQVAGWTSGHSAARSNQALCHARLGQFEQAVACLNEALAIDRELGRVTGQVINSNTLGGVYLDLGQLAEAAHCFAAALARSDEHNLPDYVHAIFRCNLGMALRDLGRWEEARDHLARSLADCREHGHRPGQALALEALAVLHRDTGAYAAARDAAREAIQVAEEVNDRNVEAAARNTLGTVYRCRNRPRQAVKEHLYALTVAGRKHELPHEIDARRGLALAYHDLGDHPQAQRQADRALRLARECGYLDREGRTLTALAEIHLCRREHPAAQQYATLALDNHRQTGYLLGQAYTYLLLGRVREQAGDPAAAHEHFRQAHVLFAGVGGPEAAAAPHH